MPQLFPNVATQYIAALVGDDLEGAKLRLFQTPGPVVSELITRAELVAAECTYTGYPANGVAITAFLDPLLAPAGGSSIDWPTVQFAAASPYTVGNTVAGWWLETAAGQLIAVGTFPSGGIAVGGPGQGFPLSGSLAFPNGF